jgi:hypothetical protein
MCCSSRRHSHPACSVQSVDLGATGLYKRAQCRPFSFGSGRFDLSPVNLPLITSVIISLNIFRISLGRQETRHDGTHPRRYFGGHIYQLLRLHTRLHFAHFSRARRLSQGTDEAVQAGNASKRYEGLPAQYLWQCTFRIRIEGDPQPNGSQVYRYGQT